MPLKRTPCPHAASAFFLELALRQNITHTTTMKIYTGSGDHGTTTLFSGERIAKHHIRVEVYGDLDELNATLGAFVAVFPRHAPDHHLFQTIRQIQAMLLHIGAWVATTSPSNHTTKLRDITTQDVQALETAIDQMQSQLPQLHDFLLPGGHITAAWAHIGRTVCRRAERHLALLGEQPHPAPLESQLQQSMLYLNRLSDYLFVLARYCNQRFGEAEIPWKP
ncbi:cob(I)yrinic acid a,c-diamide adenosyltransferase [candidate division KSB3 bacterium]|uniref:Corrinoid adenosyltransferase n=1 Tax=candidate division KSB3 bacterium TaxID=2044937 RepID=A0A9D5JX70_9BACT|nr:cob(I)yrinic acid a,c-diamide adenosyltransferase [candidate division KSB3 bacterium]MBD3325376.1 cob(I)yrinic acid a,c-diamide adenosyltransferase [candidate division KSB3 bacterium]